MVMGVVVNRERERSETVEHRSSSDLWKGPPKVRPEERSVGALLRRRRGRKDSDHGRSHGVRDSS